jgi:hypothetical protein
VGAGWRYTVGILSALGYTILPGRLFGGDNYNPYTNTINLYSDLPAVALHEGAHAKDFAVREYKGTYAFLYMWPIVPLYTEAVATSDVLSYLWANADTEGEQAAYKVLYPAYATYVTGPFVDYTTPEGWIALAGVIPGHAIGRWKAWSIGREE